MSVGDSLFVRAGDDANGTGPQVQFGAADSAVSGITAGATGTIADVTINVIPEPSAAALLVLASGAAVFCRRRR